MAFHLASS